MNTQSRIRFTPFDETHDEAAPSKVRFTSFGSLETQDQQQQLNETPEESPGILQNIVSSPVGQGILGLAKGVTFPLDILKFAMIGEGLSDIDELEEAHEREGIPFDRNEYIKKVFQLGEYIPTQELAEQGIEQTSGLNLQPQDFLGKAARTGGEIFGSSPGKLIEGGFKQVAKRGAISAASGLGAESAKEAGVPSPIADFLAYALGGNFASGKAQPKTLTPEQVKLNQIAEKFGLPKYGAFEGAKAPKNAVVSAEKQANLTRELDESSRKAIDDVITKNLPIKARRDAGIDLKESYNKAYDVVEAKAAKLGNTPIDTSNVIGSIDKRISSIKNAAPSPSASDKIRIKILEDERNALSQSTPNAQQLIQQKKNYNSNVSGIYRKPEFSGSEETVRQTYAELNEDIIKSIEKANPEIANDLKFADKIFHETSKLNQVESILGKAFENGFDSNKILRTIGGKKNQAFLERNLGKNAARDLHDIAKYGKQAESQVHKLLKKPPSLFETATSISPLGIGLILGHEKLGALASGIKLGKDAWNRAQGYLFLRPGTRNDYIKYLKEARTPNSSSFIKASRDLQTAIDKEFGSTDDFVKEVNQKTNP